MAKQTPSEKREAKDDILDLAAFVRDHVSSMSSAIDSGNWDRALSFIARAEVRLEQIKREVFKQ